MTKPISPVDLEFLAADSNISLDLIPVDKVKIDRMSADVFSGFNQHLIGFNQVPSEDHGRLHTHCHLSNIGFLAKDGLSYVPVFKFLQEDAIFDSDIYDNKPYQQTPWVVLYHGHDNCSYGMRFKNEFDADRFVKRGYLNGFFNVYGKLKFYNS